MRRQEAWSGEKERVISKSAERQKEEGWVRYERIVKVYYVRECG